MITRCANPDCARLFDYTEGRFFRFHWNIAPGEVPVNVHSVEHFWLCGACSEMYTLENRSDPLQILKREPRLLSSLDTRETNCDESPQGIRPRLILRPRALQMS